MINNFIIYIFIYIYVFYTYKYFVRKFLIHIQNDIITYLYNIYLYILKTNLYIGT